MLSNAAPTPLLTPDAAEAARIGAGETALRPRQRLPRRVAAELRAKPWSSSERRRSSD